MNKKNIRDNIWSIIDGLYYIVSNVLCCIFVIGSGNKHIISSTCVVMIDFKVVCVRNVIILVRAY